MANVSLRKCTDISWALFFFLLSFRLATRLRFLYFSQCSLEHGERSKMLHLTWPGSSNISPDSVVWTAHKTTRRKASLYFFLFFLPFLISFGEMYDMGPSVYVISTIALHLLTFSMCVCKNKQTWKSFMAHNHHSILSTICLPPNNTDKVRKYAKGCFSFPHPV